jgi:hypothetical protein
MAITVERKTNTSPGWFLSDEAKMFEALRALTDWDGDVARTDGVWQLTLRASGKQTLIAAAGVWLVDDDGLKIMDRAAFKDAYDASPFPPEAEPEAAPEADEAPQELSADEDALSVNLLQPDELDTKDAGERGVHPNA